MTSLKFFSKLIILWAINIVFLNSVFAQSNTTSDTPQSEKIPTQTPTEQNAKKNINTPNLIDYSHSFYREKTITTDDNKTEIKREYATQTIPGEELLAIATYTYKKEKPTEGVIFTLPIPKEAIYVENSATDSDYVWFSTDNAKEWSRFADLRVVDKNGTKRIALGKDVTHLQWRITKPFKKGDTGTLGYKIIIR